MLATSSFHSLLSRSVAHLVVSSSCLALTACSGMVADHDALAAEADALPHASESADAAAMEASQVAATQQALLGSDTCRNADIRVLNSLGFTITVEKVQYYDASEGDWKTEDVRNTVLSDGSLGIWLEDLGGAENDLIYSWDVIFQHGDHEHDHHVNTPDETCIPGRVFFLELQ
jgi:hypothetical protein